jgi:hypothetical protein
MAPLLATKLVMWFFQTHYINIIDTFTSSLSKKDNQVEETNSETRLAIEDSLQWLWFVYVRIRVNLSNANGHIFSSLIITSKTCIAKNSKFS